jgi:hypothetical protein
MAACSPALDWRVIRPDGAGVALQLPCRPSNQVRVVWLSGRKVDMHLHVCQASGMTFGLIWADMVDPALVTSALRELSASASVKLRAVAPIDSAAKVQGMTPNEAARRIQVSGQLPDGAPGRSDSVAFARGTRVFQATVVGARLDAAAVQAFVEALAVEP